MYKIVLVDDEEWALVYLKKIFSREDLMFEVVGTASSGYKALDLILEREPDVVMTDIRLPNMSGLALLKCLREQGYEGEAVLISAYQEFMYAKEALRYGVYDYCVKPIGRDMAENMLKQLLVRLRNKGRKAELKGADESDSGVVAKETPADGLHFQKLLVYINNHYRDKLLIKDLAGAYALSPNYCSSLFVKKTGMTFSQYLTRIRMEHAAELIKTALFSVEEVAERVGYEDAVYFYKVFKKYHGLSPAKYREQYGGSGTVGKELIK